MNWVIVLTLALFPLAAQSQEPVLLPFFCGGYGSICVDGSTCDTITGKCSCPERVDKENTFNDFDCTVVTVSAACTVSCGKNGRCGELAGVASCYCDEGYYGEDCSMLRVQTLCSEDSMFIYINPYIEPADFSGKIFIFGREQDECTFTVHDQTDTYQDYVKDADKIEGLSIELSNANAECGDVIESSSADNSATYYDREVYLRYGSVIRSGHDLTLRTRCIKSEGDTSEITGAVPSIDPESVSQIPKLEIDGQIETVVMTVVKGDGSEIEGPILLTQAIRLVFTMVPSDSFTDFIVTSCSANNAVDQETDPDNYKSLPVVTENCPAKQSFTIFNGIIAKGSTVPTEEGDVAMTTITIPLVAFLFVGTSSEVSFVCQVKLCTDADKVPCEQPTCPDLSAAPSDATTDESETGSETGNGNEPPANENESDIPDENIDGPNRRRRRRDAGVKEGAVSASMTVLDPRDLKELQQLREAVESKDCMNDPGIVACIVILSVAVGLLLILAAILVLRVANGRAKVESSRSPVQGQRPVETMHIPRLEFNHQGQGC